MNDRPKIMSLVRCAAELHVSTRYARKCFGKTSFQPAFRIHQMPFYLRSDFEQWQWNHWESTTVSQMMACTGKALCTA